jgi:hypothetical protein
LGLSTLDQRIRNEDCVLAYERLPDRVRNLTVDGDQTPVHITDFEPLPRRRKTKVATKTLYYAVFRGLAQDGDKNTLTGHRYGVGDIATGLIFTDKMEMLKRVKEVGKKELWTGAKFINYALESREEAIAAANWYVHFGPAYSRPALGISSYRGVRFGGGRPGYVCPDEASANFYARDIRFDAASNPLGEVSLKKFYSFEAARAWAGAPVAPDQSPREDPNYLERPERFPLADDFSREDIGGLRSSQRIGTR